MDGRTDMDRQTGRQTDRWMVRPPGMSNEGWAGGWTGGGRTGRRTDGQGTDGRTDTRMDGRMDGRTDGRADAHMHACTDGRTVYQDIAVQQDHLKRTYRGQRRAADGEETRAKEDSSR